ncbi:MAG TPA: hypothetical protein VGM74_21390 [Burkholderiaceae bacterium]
MRAWRSILMLIALAGAAGAAGAQVQERVLDDFSTLAPWSIHATDDVKASLQSVDGPGGRAMCIAYDFGHVTGYVSARRELPLDFPPRYEFALNVRGEGPLNALQFKLVDASGDNVWWMQRPDLRFPSEWQALKFRQRQIGFAWGPTNDRTLRRTASIELVIASGSGAGKGTACFDNLVLRRLADVPSPDEPQAFDAVTLRWPPGQGPSHYDLQFSDDGTRWRTVRHVEGAQGDVQHLWVPDSEAGAVRVLADVAPKITLADAPSHNAYAMEVAKDAPRGTYPRAYVGEQPYWTVLGVDGARLASLMGEDGAIEPIPGVGALEPFLIQGDKRLSWADARITHSLRDGDLPMPSAHWRVGEPGSELALDIEAFGDGPPEAARALARYTVRNLGKRPQAVTLALDWRPFQANPPLQFLAHPGGVSEIKALRWEGGVLSVDGTPRARPLAPPSGVRIGADAAGFANASLRFDLKLRPGERRDIDLVLPVDANTIDGRVDVARAERRVAAAWREKLDRVRLSGPAEVADVARTLRSALGHILVSRSGPALQPGARAYARSWIRDGALTSVALLRLGHEKEARDFLNWYVPFQFENGKVPCCATARGADPVPENDSDGELAFAVTELWRYTRDDATARALWPHVAAAIAHMETLRASERTDANRTPERAAYFGLMPPSISHEGYSDKPAYSYWDDFWAYIGYRSAAELARGLGLNEDAARIGAERDEFLADLRASLAASTAHFGLDVLPGAADRGDVDPTSSTIALTPGGLTDGLPDALVRHTFERYWGNFEARRRDDAAGIRHGDGAYTPYEWRVVGALVRLGERDRAQQAMAYFYRDRRPAGWNQWAEVVAHNPREPRFLGDMPHGWVGSDQIRSVLDVFAYEDEGHHSLVLAAGVPESWLSGPGVAISGLRTPYGELGWKARRGPGGRVDVEVAALRTLPPGGLVLRGPWRGPARVWVDGREVDEPADAIRLTRTPARVRIEPR